jgi:hypothetical protein
MGSAQPPQSSTGTEAAELTLPGTFALLSCAIAAQGRTARWLGEKDGGAKSPSSAASRNGMKQRASTVLYNYWNEVRGARAAPRRLEIEPGRISDVLPECFILERVDAATYRFRLAGTKICEDFGAEFRGQDFLEPWRPSDRAALLAQLTIVTEQAAVGLIEFEAWGGSRPARFEAILLPIMQSARIDRLLGALSPIVPPIWLGNERLQRRLLLRHELIWAHREARPQREEEPAMAPPPSVNRARLIRAERRQFRVYDGGLAGPDRHG